MAQKNNDQKPRDLAEVREEFKNKQSQFNQQSVFFMVKMRVTKRPELDGDYEMLRLVWQREIKKALEQLGDVKNIAVFM